jgi:hypothetical protein
MVSPSSALARFVRHGSEGHVSFESAENAFEHLCHLYDAEVERI